MVVAVDPVVDRAVELRVLRSVVCVEASENAYPVGTAVLALILVVIIGESNLDVGAVFVNMEFASTLLGTGSDADLWLTAIGVVSLIATGNIGPSGVDPVK
jgi:hypothetical protein